jgi:hypothetical protein
VRVADVGSDRAAVEALLRQLREPRPERRRRAVAALAATGAVRAVDAVVAALGDRAAEVADEAQLRLPGLLGPGLLRELVRRRGLSSGPPLLRSRWAEALGRATAPLSATGLAGLPAAREPEVARAYLWSVERLGRAGLVTGPRERLVGRLRRRCRSSRDDGVRAAALQALVALAPEEAAELLDPWLGSGRRALVCSALMAAVELAAVELAAVELGSVVGRAGPSERTREGGSSHERQPARGGAAVIRASAELEARLRAAAAHQDGAVRLRAVQLLRAGPCPAALDVLVGRLRVEERPALRAALVGALQGLTGLHHRDRPAAWEAVLRAHPEGVGPAPPAPAPTTATATAGRTVASLGALAPASDRLAILVDLSGSVWNEDEAGRSRKDVLDPQVAGLIERLPDGARFLLAMYTHVPHPFERSTVRASRRNVQRARRFLEGARMRGSGDLHEALTFALDEPDVDRVILLTDGAPSGGERWDVPLMTGLLRERLRFRPALIDVVLVDSSPRLERLWGAFASSTGGRCLSLRSRGVR